MTERAITILKKESFLDPRFKTKYLTEVDICDVETELYCECGDALSVAAPQSPHETTDPPPPEKKMSLGALFKGLETHSSVNDEPPVTISAERKFENEATIWWLTTPSAARPHLGVIL